MNSTPQPPEPDKKASREEIEADIEATRERLADDVAALAAKADVPGQVRAKVQQTRGNVSNAARKTRQQATQKVRSLPRVAQLAIPAAMAVLGVILIIAGRRQRSRPEPRATFLAERTTGKRGKSKRGNNKRGKDKKPKRHGL